MEKKYGEDKDCSVKLAKTKRGFLIGIFTDMYGSSCSIQESSLADEACVWLGVKEVNGKPARMHLTQAMVADLLPLLQHFVEHGTLPDDADEDGS